MRISSRLGPVIALVVIALMGSLSVAAPATAAGTTPVVIDILPEYTSKKAIYNDGKGPWLDGADRVSVAGVLTSGGAPLSGKPVTLQRRPKGSDTWANVGTAYTAGNGAVQILDDAKGTAAYRLFFDGSADSTYASAYSAERTVKVMRDLNAVTTDKNSKLLFKGKVAPKWAKKKIVLERKTSKKAKWKVVTQARTNKKSAWSFRLGAPRKGSWYYRAWVPGKNGFIKSYSHIEVRTYKSYFRTSRIVF
jgi:hypothetical protein